MIDHVFKKEATEQSCVVCNSHWPPAGDTIHEQVRCQKCGTSTTQIHCKIPSALEFKITMQFYLCRFSCSRQL